MTGPDLATLLSTHGLDGAEVRDPVVTQVRRLNPNGGPELLLVVEQYVTRPPTFPGGRRVRTGETTTHYFPVRSIDIGAEVST